MPKYWAIAMWALLFGERLNQLLFEAAIEPRLMTALLSRSAIQD